MNIKGFIFDLDGTLVDSRLDFSAIRADLGLAAGVPILEALRERTAEEQVAAEAVRRAGIQTLLYLPVPADFETGGAETFTHFAELRRFVAIPRDDHGAS